MSRAKLYPCFIFTLTCYLLASCSKQPAPEIQRTILRFGTLIDVTLYNVEPALAERALDQLEQNFHQYHADWTPWQESLLSTTNQRLGNGDSFDISPELLPLIEQSIVLSKQSQGLFNPAIGKLIRLWQFHKHDDPDIKPPTAAEIAELVEKIPSMENLVLDGSHIHSTNPAVELNFGAFAKGYAIDLSMQYLHQLGISNAVINAGGDLSVSGNHGDRPWRIGIRHPRKDRVIAWLDASENESIFTSGDYERFYIYEGRRYHHILDPRTGYPTEDSTSVTVIHDNAGVADAAATAIFIAGSQHWQEIARAMGIKHVMLIDANGTIHISPSMRERLHFDDDDNTIVISEPL